LERAREVVLRLSPDRLCLGGLLDLRDAAPDVVRGVVGVVIDMLLGGGVLVRAASAAIEALAGRSLGQLLMKWGIIKNETVECLKNIVNTAKEASQYIDDEGLRDVVEEVAKKWGWDVDTFKRFVKTAAGKSITEDEVKKMIEEALKNIEKELGKVRERVSGLLAGVEVFFINDFEDGLAYPTVRLDNGELMVLGEYGYHEVVRTGSFSTLTNEVKQRLRAGSLVALTGPKGVGKSTLATVTTWELLRSGEVGMVLRIRELPEGEVVERFRSFIESFLTRRDWEYFGNMVILYDPTGVYGQIRGVEAPSELETTVRNVFEAVRRAIENAKSILGREPSARVGVLIILPTDLYNALSNDVKGKLESYRLDAPLNDTEFLAGLIREYMKMRDKPNGCALSNDVLNKLASELAKFDSGHALIARFAGEELARSNCDVGRIEELISTAKGKAEAFIIQYINKLFKVDENPDTAKALVEIFALRRPFIDETRPGEPILAPGIIKLIGEVRGAKLLYSAVGEELRGWLAIRQHDLIEEAIEELLDCIVGKGEECEELGDALLKPWMDVHVPRIRSRTDAVKYFAKKYGKRFIEKIRGHKNCWRRAALIIGAALAGYGSVPRPEDLLGVDDESLSNALNKCEIDNYLLLDNEIPLLIRYLIRNHTRVLTKPFIDKCSEAIVEIRKITRNKGIIFNVVVHALYWLGLISIIANAAKTVESNDADVVLRIASYAIGYAIRIKPILRILRSLSDKAPHSYIGLLSSALLALSQSGMAILDNDKATVRYILKELNRALNKLNILLLNKHGKEVREYAWSLFRAINAYTDLLRMRHDYFSKEEIEDIANKVAELLNKIDNTKSHLSAIAWAIVLFTALESEDEGVRKLMEEKLHVNIYEKAREVCKELSGLLGKIGAGKVEELLSDEVLKDYIKSKYINIEGYINDAAFVDAVVIDDAIRMLLAAAKGLECFDKSWFLRELNKATVNKVTDLFCEHYILRSWMLRFSAIEDSLNNHELIDGFKRLYEGMLNKEIKPTSCLSAASCILSEYLISLALINDVERINELLEKHWELLNADKEVSVLTRLALNVLLRQRGELNSGLEGKLVVEPRELIETFKNRIYREFLPALMVTYRLVGPEDGYEECESIKVSMRKKICKSAVSAAKGDGVAIKQLRERLIDTFSKRVSREELNLLKGFSFDVKSLIDKFRGLVNGPNSNELDVKSLVQLLAPIDPRARLAFMLYSLIDGNEELAKAHALIGAVEATEKLPARLFLETYESCCDLSNESFRRAVAKLFFYHV
jgi:hypothetical protein